YTFCHGALQREHSRKFQRVEYRAKRWTLRIWNRSRPSCALTDEPELWQRGCRNYPHQSCFAHCDGRKRNHNVGGLQQPGILVRCHFASHVTGRWADCELHNKVLAAASWFKLGHSIFWHKCVEFTSNRKFDRNRSRAASAQCEPVVGG